jgi:transcriptional antiterminator RfaH
MLDALPARRLDAAEPDLTPRRCGSYWAVCQTHPQAERWAVANLERQGYVTFLPLVRVLRRDRSLPTLRHHVLAPLFTSYVFVQVDRHWAPIQHTSGVRRLLMADGRPGIVPQAAVEAVRSALEAEQARAQEDTKIAAGTAVALSRGSLEGHPGLVLDVLGERAKVAVMLFGALRTVSVPTASLVAQG